MINYLIDNLKDEGYFHINANTQGVEVLCKRNDDAIEIISMIYLPNGIEISLPSYENMLEQIKYNFLSQGAKNISLLSIICTNNPHGVRHLCIDRDEHWIIDLMEQRLIIYENQSMEQRELINSLEQFLSDYKIGYYSNTNYGERSSGAKKITMINITIVLINVLIHLLLRYTNVFGTVRYAVTTGGLSWYYVFQEQEYYRILTSMFMHTEFNHLLNNMIVLLFVGGSFERAVGRVKYIFIYFGSGIIAGLSSIVYNMMRDTRMDIQDIVYSIGASGAIFGVVGAMVYILILNKGRLEDISSRQIILFALFSLYGGIINARVDNLAHIGGFLGGLMLAVIFYRRPRRDGNMN